MEAGQPLAYQVVGDRGIFLDIVIDQVRVAPVQVLPANPVRPYLLQENLQLEGKIEQVVIQAVAAKACCAVLGVFIYVPLGGSPIQAALRRAAISVCGKPTTAALLRLSRIWVYNRGRSMVTLSK